MKTNKERTSQQSRTLCVDAGRQLPRLTPLDESVWLVGESWRVMTGNAANEILIAS